MANPERINHHNQGSVVYVIESKRVNDHLWARQPTLRDAIVTIGTFVLMTFPNGIDNYLGNDVPIVESHEPLLILKRPRIDEVPIDDSLTESVTRAFVLKNCEIEIDISSPVVTKCCGLLCDRQNALANLKNNKVCGCYGISDRVSNLVYQHKIDVFREGDKQFTIKKFTSFKFDQMFLKGTIKQICKNK